MTPTIAIGLGAAALLLLAGFAFVVLVGIVLAVVMRRRSCCPSGPALPSSLIRGVVPAKPDAYIDSETVGLIVDKYNSAKKAAKQEAALQDVVEAVGFELS